MAYSEVQKDELTAMKSIYEADFVINENKLNNALGGSLYVHFEVPDLEVVWKDLRDERADLQRMKVQFLPPVNLTFHFPPEYPIKSAPFFDLSCQWLTQSQISKISSKLIEIWEENKGNEVLFLWANFLEDECLTFMNIQKTLNVSILHTQYIVVAEKNRQDYLGSTSQVPVEDECAEKCGAARSSGIHYASKQNNAPGDICGAKEDKTSKVNIVLMLMEYNKLKKNCVFPKQLFVCTICYDEHSGTNCLRFETCSHVFCRSCLKDYFEIRISEGNVQNLQCPEQECCTSVEPCHIKDVVCPDVYSKYEEFLLKTTLDRMPDVLQCPMRLCQYSFIYDVQDRSAKCPRCEFAFCVFCKKNYHGIEPCYASEKDKEALVKEYLSASSDRKEELENRFGKMALQWLVERVQSEEWVKSNSKKCPCCHVPIEKFTGCNRVICRECGSVFCWLCMQILGEDDGYNHFFTPNSYCNNMLFHGTFVDEEFHEENANLNVEEENDVDNFIFFDGHRWGLY